MNDWPPSANFNELLEQIRSEDIMFVLEGMTQLKNALVIAGTDQLGSSFPMEPMLAQLVVILKQPQIPGMDIQGEIKFMATSCVINLIDVHPQLVGRIVSHGAVEAFVDMLREYLAIYDIEGAGLCIKALKAISLEDPGRVLRSKCLKSILDIIDFSDNITQSYIVDTLVNVSRSANSEQEFRDCILPCLQKLSEMMLMTANTEQEMARSEKVSKVLFSVAESFRVFLHPIENFDKIGSLLEEMADTGLIEGLVKSLGDFSAFRRSQRAITEQQPQQSSQDQQMSSIETSQHHGNRTHTDVTVQNYLQILQVGCYYSQSIVMQIFGGGIFDILEPLLIQDENADSKMQSMQHAVSVINLLDAILPSPEEKESKSSGKNERNQKNTIIEGSEVESVFRSQRVTVSHQEQFRKASANVQQEKRLFFKEQESSVFQQVIKTMMPKIFLTYAQHPMRNFRIKALLTIEKIVVIAPESCLKGSIDPNALARFIQTIFESDIGPQILISLRLLSKVLSASAQDFGLALVRAGIGHQVKEFALTEAQQHFTEQAILRQKEMGSQPPSFAQRYAQGLFGMPSFGGKSSEEKNKQIDDTIAQITLSLAGERRRLEQLKEEGGDLALSKAKIVELDRMLNHLYETKERYSVELEREADQEIFKKMLAKKSKSMMPQIVKEVDSPKSPGLEEEANKKLTKTKSSDNLNKEEKTEEAVEEKKSPELLEGENIMNEAESLLSKFFNNENFKQNLKEQHPEEAGIFDKLKNLASQVNELSCKSEFDLAKNLEVLGEMNQLMTNAHEITFNEFTQSGLIKALDIFLTRSPSQAKSLLQNEQKEESKSGKVEDIVMINTEMTKAERRILVHRLKVFTRMLATQTNGKMPFKILVNLNNGALSQHEGLIIQDGDEKTSGQHEAIRQLTRRVPINLVFEPDKGSDGKLKRKNTDTPMKVSEKKSSIEDAEMIEVNKSEEEPAAIVSEAPKQNTEQKPSLPFESLRAQGANPQPEHSRIFELRHTLYSELKSVAYPVESLSKCVCVMEEFLKSRICSVKDVNVLKAEARDRFMQEFAGNSQMIEIFETMENRMLDMIDEATEQQIFRELAPDFIDDMSEQISPMIYEAKLTQGMTHSLFTHLRSQTQHHIREQGLPEQDGEGSEGSYDAHMEEREQIDRTIEEILKQKIDEFMLMIDKLHRQTMEKVRNMYRGGRIAHKKGKKKADRDEMFQFLVNAQKKTSETQDNKDQQKQQQQDQEMKDEKEPKTKIEILEQSLEQLEQIQQESLPLFFGKSDKEVSSVEKAGSEANQSPAQLVNEQSSSNQSASNSVPVVSASPTEQHDIEMTEENQNSESEKDRNEEEKNDQAKTESKQPIQVPPVDGSEEDSNMEGEEAVPMDQDHASCSSGAEDSEKLEIKEQVKELSPEEVAAKARADELKELKEKGSDVSIEFYYRGKKLRSNQSLYDVFVQASREAHQSEFTSETKTITFRIVDNDQSLGAVRKDSLLQLVRTKSFSAHVEPTENTIGNAMQQILNEELEVPKLSRVLTQSVSLEQNSKMSQENKNKREEGFSDMEACLKLLKLLHFLYVNIDLMKKDSSDLLLANSIEEFKETIMESDFEIAQCVTSQEIDESSFRHHKLDTILLRQTLQNPYKISTGAISTVLLQIFSECPFLFSYATKVLFLQIVKITSVDIKRSLMNLKQYMEKNKKTVEDPHLNQILFAQGDSRSGIDLRVQKETVNREKIVEGADLLVEKIQPGMILQIMYHGEVGHGLGPTLEFYNLLAAGLKDQQFEIGQNKQMASIWRSGVPHRGLFPREIDPQMTDREILKKVCRLFHVTGTFVAKCILDNRLMEMPFSPLMWDLIFAKKVNIFSLKAIDPSLYQYFRELQKIANRKVEIEEDSKLSEETRQNMLKEQQQVVEDMDLTFYSPCNPEIELVKGGNDLKVTVDNLQEYIDLVVHNIFYDTINLQIDAFKSSTNILNRPVA